MKISFDNENLRSICENYETAIEKYDLEATTTLHTRLSDIESAEDFDEIGVGITVFDLKDINKIIIYYYLDKKKTQYLKFEIPQNEKLVNDFNKIKKITRIKLIKIKL